MVQHAFLENDIVNNLVILNSSLKDIVNHLQDIFHYWVTIQLFFDLYCLAI